MAKLPDRFSRAWRILPGILLLAIPILAWRVVREFQGIQTKIVTQEPAMTITARPAEPARDTQIGSGWTARLRRWHAP